MESNSHTIKGMVYINLQSHVTLISFLEKHKDSMIEVICAQMPPCLFGDIHETRFTFSWESSVSYYFHVIFTFI